ncbi:hypothetical protein B0G84_7774 [Paraburkholderia sp. BL8N3]|nr:hypothetical protein B0G84_7774 [Paraburkholderia sp. BL8N3]
MFPITISSRDAAPAASQPMLDTLNKRLDFTPNGVSITSVSLNACTGRAGLRCGAKRRN